MQFPTRVALVRIRTMDSRLVSGRVMANYTYLTDAAIDKLKRRGRIIECERWLCQVCDQVVHDKPKRRPGHFQCHNRCRLEIVQGEDCRICGDPVTHTTANRVYCDEHFSYVTSRTNNVPTGAWTMRQCDTHWHAADNTGSVSQYDADAEQPWNPFNMEPPDG